MWAQLAPCRSELQECVKFSKIYWQWTCVSPQVIECAQPEPRGCGLKDQDPLPTTPNLRGDRPAQRKDSYPSSDTVTAVRAPDSWRPKSLPRPRLCKGRVSGARQGAVSVPTTRSASPLGFFSSTSGLPRVPLPRRSWLSSGSRDARRRLRQSNSKSPFLLEGRKGVPTASHNFRAPPSSQLSPADGRLPRQAPRLLLAYLGVHTKLTGPRRRSHIVSSLPAPAPSPDPRRGAAGRRPHSSGGNCGSGVSSKLPEEEAGGPPGRLVGPAREPAARRGTRDGEPAGAPGRGGGSGGGGDRELQPAPRARVRHYLALRLSFDWSNGAAPRPPPSARPRHRYPCGAAA